MALIYIAEDDDASRELLADMLVLWGHEVKAFANGAELVQALTAEVPQLMLLDIQMPVMDGTKTMQHVRARGLHHLPILALTAFAMATERERILANGFDGYMAKPISVPELRGKIDQICGAALAGGAS